MILLDGELELVEVLEGEGEAVELLDGEYGEFAPISDVHTYDGPYEVEPANEAQEIEIEGLKATENIIVKAIPSSYGRLSWDGSRLRVY